MPTVLIVDDDPEVGSALGAFFERGGHQVARVESGEAAIEAVQRLRPDLVLLDQHLPDLSGVDVLARLRPYDPVVIMITGHGDVRLAVQAMREGAENFLAKPVDLELLEAAAARAFEKARLRRAQRQLDERRGGAVAELLGPSPAMREIAHQIGLLAASAQTTVLLVGESGTGKRRIAAAIHAHGPRAAGPFVEASCVGRPPEALERELFGAESAGARASGLCEMAHQGTLFLDEVAAPDATVQGRLLRLLEGGVVRPMGGARDVETDVRVVAATAADLVAAVNAGRLREDLYYRLSVMPVHLPPLRARSREDLLFLVRLLIADLQPQLPNAPGELTEPALEQLLRYAWPGNVRELRNVLERAMIVGRGAWRIGVEHLPPEIRAAGARHHPRSLAEVERAHIERTLRAHDGNRTRAARELGISRATLIGKIRQFGLSGAAAHRDAGPSTTLPSDTHAGTPGT